MNTHRLNLASETKVLSEKERSAEFIASDQTIDSYNEIVRAAGWKFGRFKLNAPFVDSHDYSSIEKLLGNVTSWKVAGDRLVESVKLLPEGISRLADVAWKMIAGGFVRAVSVGFMPLKVRSRWRDEADFIKACTELGVDKERAKTMDVIHWEQEQTELSAVLIGANPSAVALAHRSGAVADEDLASIGFSDDDMAFLHEAAAGWDSADAVLRKEIRRSLRGIVKLSAGNNPTPLATKAPATGDDEDGQARRALLADLTRVATPPAQLKP
jgi:hypothetical protein